MRLNDASLHGFTILASKGVAVDELDRDLQPLALEPDWRKQRRMWAGNLCGGKIGADTAARPQSLVNQQ